MKKAADVYRNLNGIICLYKPAEASCSYAKLKLIRHLCYDLNQLETRPCRERHRIVYDGKDFVVKVIPDYADDIMCVGPRYQPDDFKVIFPSLLGDKVSGVLVACINEEGKEIAKAMEKSFFSKCYHIKGILGQATSNFHISEKVIAKAKFSHINLYHITRILSSYQAAAQRRLFQEYGFDSSSQESYELAVSGLFRPREKLTPILYNMSVIKFEPPHFTLEVQCINENETFLMNMIHNLGVSLKTFATCVSLQCIRYGCFTTEHALLLKHWNINHVLDNMNLCFDLLQSNFSNVLSYKATLQPQSAAKKKITDCLNSFSLIKK